jgi:hypothetical protein
VTLFGVGRELPAEVFVVFFAIFASLAFRFSASFAIFAFLASSSSFAFFICSFLRVKFLCMLYVESNIRDGKRGTYGPALGQRDVGYRGAILIQLDAFIMLSVSHVKETVSGPPKKVWSDLRVVCIVVDVLEGRDAARRCASLRR